MTSATVDIVTTPEAFAALESEWDSLGVRAWGPLVPFDWFSAAIRHLSAGAPALRIVTVRRDGRLVAAAPLCVRRSRGLQRLEIIGASSLHEPTQLLAVDDAALALLCAALARQALPTVIQRLSADDRVLAVLRAEAAGAGARCRVAERAATHHLPVRDPDQLSAKRRSRLAYHARALERAGVQALLLSPTPDEVGAAFDAFVRVETAGWKGRNLSSLASRSDLRRFFADVCVGLARRGQLKVWVMRSEQSWIAAQLCAQAAGRVWVLKMGFDESWKRYSPGFVQTAAVVDYCRGADLAFEFLGAAEDWQRPWRPETRRHCAAIVYPRTVAGFAAFWLDTAIALVRGARRDRRRASERATTAEDSAVDDARDTRHARYAGMRENSCFVASASPTAARDFRCVE
jgi:CelD/BcsL family acetyltransferase involved in cellulose biosynthesis